ncbi:MAG: hypothetical protein DRJ05_12645 [Bacteroidetes bacterium]|nr:MAG: hypothetical protein DRJ05_12645 [Bacteroidota bacterium]
MRKTITLFLLTCLFITGVNLTTFGSPQKQLTNHLVEQMELVSENDFIKINITLKDQYDSQALIATAKTMGMAERREYVINVLKDFTELSQKGVIADLNQMQQNQMVKEVMTFWIANVVNCKATPAAIEQLALRDDIASIDYDEKRILIDPMENKDAFPVEGVPGSKEITWNVLKINATDVWALGINGEGIIVSVIDTGVNYDHNDLNDHVWQSTEYPNHGYDFVNNDNDPMDDHGHGTHCSGTVAGDGTAGSQTGIAPEATIMCCKVLDAGGGGEESGVWAAIEFSVEQGAHVMSLSLGWQHSWGPNRTVWRETFDNSLAAGVIASVAAGNEGGGNAPDNVRTPGDLPPAWLHPDQTLIGGLSGIICVGSTTSNDIVSDFSSRGPLDWSTIAPFNDYPYNPEIGLIRPDIAAPGSNIKSLAHYSNTGYEDGWSGTSMATPANAGMIALMLQKNELLTPEQICQTIEETAHVLTPGKNNNTGSGRIDALAAVEATSYPGPSYYSHSLNDASGNNNGEIDPAESILINLSMANFSEEIVNGVTVELSTESEYVTITDNTEYFGDFDLEDIIEITDAFAFDVANNIPGGTEVRFNILASTSEDEWQSSFIEIPNGVNLEVGSLSVSDPDGNNNGRLDPGETADILIETSNVGQIDALATLAVFSCANSFITVNSGSFDLGTIDAGQTAVATFNITVDVTTPIGTSVEFAYEATSGFYNVEHSFFPKIGIILEDFETGDFTQFAWEFTGNQDWDIVNSEVYEGVYSAKSGDVNDNQSSGLQLEYEVADDDVISFYRKVSSEASWDYLQFYIDNIQIEQWSGDSDWEQFTYPVSAGVHTFKWIFEKDGSVSNGSDCGWVDYIELPTMADQAMSVNAGNDEDVCENATFETNAVAQSFETALWETSGTGTFANETALNTTYTPSTADYESGMTTLTLTVSDEGESLSDDVVIEFVMFPDAAGSISGENLVCIESASDYEVDNINNADTYFWELDPASAGSFSGSGSTITINWTTYTGEALLKVRGENDCGEGGFSDEFVITVDGCTGIHSINQNDNIVISPNPSNGFFTIDLSQSKNTYQAIKITELSGKLIYESREQTEGQISVQLDIDNGIYLLILENDNSRSVHKIVVQH